jgi:hypothetical protein
MPPKFHKVDSVYLAVASETLRKQVQAELAKEDPPQLATALAVLAEPSDKKEHTDD